jgi:hypothetical protein
MQRFLLVLLLVVAGLVPAAGAFAQSTTGGGVTVDPNSPSGTEYDIPVQKARRDAQGTKKAKPKAPAAPRTTTSTSGDEAAPLFGQGVQPDKPSTTTTATTPPPATTQASPPTPAPAKRHRPATATTQTTPPPAATVATTTPPAAQQPAPQQVQDADLAAKAAASDNGPTPAIAIAGGAVVLLLAGLSGWLLRRRAG